MIPLTVAEVRPGVLVSFGDHTGGWRVRSVRPWEHLLAVPNHAPMVRLRFWYRRVGWRVRLLPPDRFEFSDKEVWRIR